MSKRTLDSFFTPTPMATKKQRVGTHKDEKLPGPDSASEPQNSPKVSAHASYPFSIPHLPESLSSELELLVTAQGKTINDQPHLDLLYFEPFIPKPASTSLFHFLRGELPFYRVTYNINRFGKSTIVNTPRYTTVFGMDATSLFADDGNRIVEAFNTAQDAPKGKYKCRPRPIPECLDLLRRVTEAATDTQYNFCLVNYYASGSDSISYHSDDEAFLGPDPAIASFTLGARRDFVMRHKPAKEGQPIVEARDIKLPLGSGDMVLMRGKTQSHWLHSIPKRKGGEADRGRINITLRKAMVPSGTENYYRYNVGDGPVYKWDESSRKMVLWNAEGKLTS